MVFNFISLGPVASWYFVLRKKIEINSYQIKTSQSVFNVMIVVYCLWGGDFKPSPTPFFLYFLVFLVLLPPVSEVNPSMWTSLPGICDIIPISRNATLSWRDCGMVSSSVFIISFCWNLPQKTNPQPISSLWSLTTIWPMSPWGLQALSVILPFPICMYSK